nr:MULTISPECIES: hypothetical protein [Delftia]
MGEARGKTLIQIRWLNGGDFECHTGIIGEIFCRKSIDIAAIDNLRNEQWPCLTRRVGKAARQLGTQIGAVPQRGAHDGAGAQRHEERPVLPVAQHQPGGHGQPYGKGQQTPRVVHRNRGCRDGGSRSDRDALGIGGHWE